MDGLSLRGKSNSPSFPVDWMDHIAAIEEKYTLDILRLSATASLKCHQIPLQISGTEWQQEWKIFDFLVWMAMEICHWPVRREHESP